jgi:hypothetical protein
LQAGAARIDITPPEDAALRLWGYEERTQPFQGIHDRLYCRAIVLDDGQQRAAIVSCDMALVIEPFWQKVADRVKRELAIAPAYLLLAATHTHSAPESNYCFSEAMVEKLVAVVKQAAAALQPARLGVARGHCNINVNRVARCAKGAPRAGWWLGVNPDGPADKTVHVLKLETLDGRPIALLVNYAAHGTTMGKESLALSADHPGACSRFVESHYGGEVVVPWTSGAAADVDPIYAYCRDFGGRLNPVESLGRILGEEVVRVAEGIKTTSTVSLRAYQTVITVPGQKNLSGLKFRPEGDYQFVDAKPVPIRLSVLLLGDVAICGISGEVFTQIGERIKKSSPCPETIVITHVNGSSGYLPTDEAYERIGYEILVTGVKRGVEKLLVEGATRAIRQALASRSEKIGAK